MSRMTKQHLPVLQDSNENAKNRPQKRLPSWFNIKLPNAKQQAIAQIVNINLAVMPFVAINTIISIMALAIDPNMFTHSDRVLGLPEYTEQSSIMEEGGLLGFGLMA